MKKLKHPYKSASNGQEALDAYKAQPGRYCCVLMGKLQSRSSCPEPALSVLVRLTRPSDISMPVMDGLESTRHIREFERQQGFPAATIIALTGLASASVQQEAFASGIDLFMTKPVRLKELGEVFRERGLK
jgi:CheY-like chemotaxis protein